MSDFSSLDLDQSIEQSSVIDTLRQPIWIALFTSLAIHGILGINLPKLFLFSEPAKLPPTVGLVELTPEQLEGLPQPEKPEITFSTIPAPPNFSLVVPSSPGVPFWPQSSSSELPKIPVAPSNYNLPKLPPEDSTASSSANRSSSTPSVSRLPRNPSPTDYSYNYPSIPRRSPLSITPIYPPPLPNINRQPTDIFQTNPQQKSNQDEIDEYQLRKNFNLTDKVYDSGLSRRQTLEIDPQTQTDVLEDSTRQSYSTNLQLPPRRYQDKAENQIAVNPNQDNTNTNTPTEKAPVARVTPEASPKPDSTKKNRLPEAPIVRQLRGGKTIQDVAAEAKQQTEVAVATPESPTDTNQSQQKIELQETPSLKPTPKPSLVPEKPKEFKGSLLEKFEQSQQAQVTDETTPTPKPSPQPEENLAAATVEEAKPPAAEKKETPSVIPDPEPTPPVQPPAEFKGSLLQKLKQQQENNAAVTEDSQSIEIALGAVGAYMQWAIELELEEESLTPSQPISDVYPEAACEQKLEGKAAVGVLVNSDGTIERGPKLLLESGYPVLDEAALDAVSKESFSSSDRSKLYQYEFNFDSSNCSAAKPSSEENAPAGETLPTQERE